MSRAERLLALLHLLRRHRRPVSAAALAEELAVSPRTLYRDVASLRAQGAAIDGEPGVGYLLRPGFILPPLMFAPEELEALALGSRWVMDRGDPALRAAARDALAKIAAVLPPERRDDLIDTPLLIGPSAAVAPPTQIDLSLVRRAIRLERKLLLRYRDLKEAETERIVWPCALGYFDAVRVLAAWCELRCGFRHFRVDRMLSATLCETRYPRRRAALVKEWRAAEGIATADNS